MAVILVAAGGNVQTAINSATWGDVIKLEANATFTGTFTLPLKTGTATNYITITSNSADVDLPNATTRTGPIFSPKLAKLQAVQDSAHQNGPVFETADGAHHYKLVNLEILPNWGGSGDLILLGNNQTGAQVTYAQQPDSIVLDRLYIHGHPVEGQKRAVSLHGTNLTVTNCYISGIAAVGQDSMAIWGCNGEGPFTITNNFLQGATYAFLTGGDDPKIKTVTTVAASPAPTSTSCRLLSVTDLAVGELVAFHTDGGTVTSHATVTSVNATTKDITFTWDPDEVQTVVPDVPGDARWGVIPADITFRRNHCHKPLEWRTPILGTPNGVSAVAGTGGSFTAGTYTYRVRATALGYQRQAIYGDASADTSVSVATSGTVSVVWSGVTNATGYTIFRQNPDSTWTSFAVTGATVFLDQGTAGTAATAPGAGQVWQIKTHFELKVGRRVQCDSNVIENIWVTAAAGGARAFWIKSVNQNWGAGFNETADVVIEKNVIRHCSGFINFSGTEWGNGDSSNQVHRPAIMKRVTVRQNLVYDSGAGYGNIKAFSFSNGGHGFDLHHNTVIHTISGIADLVSSTNRNAFLVDLGVADNLFRRESFGFKGAGAPSTNEGTIGLAAHAQNQYTFVKNVLAGASASVYPPDNFTPTVTTFEAQFVDYVGGDYHLAPGSLYIGQATDLTNIGADIDLVLDAVAGVESGIDTPPAVLPFSAAITGTATVYAHLSETLAPTRLYMPSSGTPPLAALAFGSGWQKTSQATRLPLRRTLTNTSTVERSVTSSVTSPELHLNVQYQLPGLAAQVITGTLKGQITARVNNLLFTGTLAIAARVVSSDGATLRGELLAVSASATATTPPLLTTSTTNRSFTNAADSASLTLTSVTAQANDVLIVEVGARDVDTGTSRSAVLTFKDTTADPELPEDNTATGTAYNPWVEFSQRLTFVEDTVSFSASIVGSATVAATLATALALSSTILGSAVITATIGVGFVLQPGAPSLMVARLGVMRLGAARLGYYLPTVRITVNDVPRNSSQVRIQDLSVRDVLFGAPNIATLRVHGFTPSKGHEVRIGLGSVDPAQLLFRGRIQSLSQGYDADNRVNVYYDLTCVSGEWLLNRRKVNERYQSISATAIVKDLMATYAPEITTNDVAPWLPALDEITFTDEDLTRALDRIADRIGAVWVLEYDNDLTFALDLDDEAAPITDTGLARISDLQWEEDLSQVKTRILSMGGGSVTVAPVDVGSTILPIQDPLWYQDTGGEVRVGTQRVSYGGIVEGGAGALVGTAITPTNAPVVGPSAGAGLSNGTYQYAVSFVTATGETPPSPVASITIDTSTVAAPTTIGTPFPGGTFRTGVGALDFNAVYGYVYTFFGGGTRETTPSPAATFTTNGNPSDNAGALGISGEQAAPAGFQRRYYRTEGGGAIYKLLPSGQPQGQFLEISSGYYIDVKSDAQLGAAAPSVNTTLQAQVAVSSIAIGPSGVIGRNVYRTIANGAQLKLAAQIANNTATTYTDSLADGSLGVNAPTANTSGLAATGEVQAGATEITVTSNTPFQSTGGWAVVGSVPVRYSGTTGTSLTGVPANGTGALTTTMRNGTQIVALSMLIGIPATGTGSIQTAIAQNEEVNVFVQCDDEQAQAAMAALTGTDGIFEESIADRRLSVEEATARGFARLALQKDPVITARYTTRHPSHKSGRLVSLTLGPPTNLTGEFRIQSVTISDLDPLGTRWPLRQVEASSRKFSLEALLRLIKAA